MRIQNSEKFQNSQKNRKKFLKTGIIFKMLDFWF